MKKKATLSINFAELTDDELLDYRNKLLVQREILNDLYVKELSEKTKGDFDPYSRRADRIFKKSYINSTNEAGEYCLNLFYARIYESFFVICLNSQNKVISCEKVSEGASDEIVVYPRHIARMAIRNNAVKVIIAHNHPGGTTIPSTEDISITREIKDSLNVVGVELFDHIIVSDNEYNSFAKLNLL